MNPDYERTGWINDERVTSYFLGESSQEECARLEEACFEDEGLANHAFALESELIDDYLRGALSPGQRLHFERNYLTTDQRLERLEFAIAFRRQVKPGVQRISPGPEPADRLGWRHFLTPPRLAFVVLLIAAACAGIWLLLPHRGSSKPDEIALTASPSPESTATPRMIPPSPAPTQRAAPPRTAITTITLLPGGLKSGDQASDTLRVPSDVALAEIRMVFGSDDFSSYHAIVQNRAGKTVWSARNLKRTMRPDGLPEIVLRIPANRLKPGEYAVQLLGAEAGSVLTIGDYNLLVAAR